MKVRKEKEASLSILGKRHLRTLKSYVSSNGLFLQQMRLTDMLIDDNGLIKIQGVKGKLNAYRTDTNDYQIREY